MHCELIVPGLMPTGDNAAAILEGLRLPALELLLARSRHTTDEAVSFESWIAESFDCDGDAEIPAGALTLAALGGQPGDAVWMRADPVHLRLNRDQLVLVPASAFDVQQVEAEALVETLNRHFEDELMFYPLQAGRWCVRVDLPTVADLRSECLAAVAGRDINRHLPSGAASKRWHSLLNEIQMRLHEHAVNEARELRGEPPVNSVWLWGAGKLPAQAAAPWQSVTTDDPLAAGYAQVAGIRHRPVLENADEWLARLPEDGRQLVVLDTLRIPLALGDFETWRGRIVELDARWCAPLVAALKSGRIGMLSLTVPDSTELRSFESARNDLRHFWRRLKPLATMC